MPDDSTFQHRVPLPPGMRVVRHQPPKIVQTPAGQLPLIDPAGPDSQQIQQVLKTRVRQFDMTKEVDVQALEELWQKIADGDALPSENVTSFTPTDGRYVVYVRWSEFSYVAPRQPGT